jgi:hypothetical protein
MAAWIDVENFSPHPVHLLHRKLAMMRISETFFGGHHYGGMRRVAAPWKASNPGRQVAGFLMEAVFAD